MKRIVLLLFILFMAVGTQASPPAYFIDQVIEEADGVLLTKEVNDDIVIYRVRVPSYYDFDLVRMSLKRIMDKYSDVTFSQIWHLDEDKDYLCFVRVVKSLVLICYVERNNLLIFSHSID